MYRLPDASTDMPYGQLISALVAAPPSPPLPPPATVVMEPVDAATYMYTKMHVLYVYE